VLAEHLNNLKEVKVIFYLFGSFGMLIHVDPVSLAAKAFVELKLRQSWEHDFLVATEILFYLRFKSSELLL